MKCTLVEVKSFRLWLSLRVESEMPFVTCTRVKFAGVWSWPRDVKGTCWKLWEVHA